MSKSISQYWVRMLINLIFSISHLATQDLMETQEEVKEEGVGYVVMRNLFSRETGFEMRTVKKSRETSLRESAERLALSRKMHEKEEFQKKMNPDSLTHPPEFIVKPRGQTVWEGKSVTLHCTVAGWPKPCVTWYKNNVLIDAKAHPEKYFTESQYNMHSLEIKNCNFSDTAEYRISALNVKGESSAFAPLIIKSEYFTFLKWISNLQLFLNNVLCAFDVSFGHEGETMSLGCTVIVYPTVKRYQPEIVWYRNGVVLSPSKWVHMHWSGERATLTLVHLNKEDEGLYTLRVNTKSGFDTHSAYVFVRDADVEEEGVPVAPLDVRCHDANKDYVVVTWKQPAVEGSSSIIGYFIDRLEVGTHHWTQCNDTPVKYARFPVTGLTEGRSYTFRVRALNNSGVSRPSRASDPVVAMDPSDRALTAALFLLSLSVGVVPGSPTDLAVTEATKSYVVLSWKPPIQRGHEGVMYYVEKCLVGTDTWQRVNTGMPVKSPRFALFDLAEGKSYSFRVRSCNSAGVGESSEETGATTVGDRLDLPSVPGPVIPIRNTDTSVVVCWGASKEVKNLVGYYIEVSVSGSGVWVPCNNKPVKGTRFVCHGLNTGDKCVFRVKAVNAAGYSGSSAESEACIVQATVPSPPTGVTLLERVRDYMVLGWQAPAKTGGADIRGYYLDYRTVKNGVTSKWHEINLQTVTGTSYKVTDLKENVFYQFQVRAVNRAGISESSIPTVPLECKEWTVAVPGPAHSLRVQEVRKDSMVLLWEPPTFSGRSPVTGYYVDYKEENGRWRCVQERSTKNTYMKVTGLQEGVSYRLRIHAKNVAGVGKHLSLTTCISSFVTHVGFSSGTNAIMVDVDDDGVISLIFECSDLKGDSQFVWSKNYKAFTDTSRLTVQTSGGKSRAIFNDPSLEDLGTYSCVVTNTDGVSSSYTLTEEGESLFFNMRLQTKGTQGNHYFLRSAESTAAYTMNFNKTTGIIEMFMDSLEVTDEGTFTFNLVDGKATGRTSLVLIGEGEIILIQSKVLSICLFTVPYHLKKPWPMTLCVFPLFLTGSRESKISHSDRVQCGVTGEQLWLKINEPTEKDKGKYAIDIFNGQGSVKRVLDLSGQVWEELLETAYSMVCVSADRARVVGGLPDVVTIQEGKSLNLTGNVWGDPVPEVSWVKNDKPLLSDDHYTLKFEHGKFASITIAAVTTIDSGKYALLVKNKYGTEAGEFTVSVYIPEDEAEKKE
uniref:Myomesin 1a (skelemin) n=1 Tax=Cyprinus carpio TaxID=7962 RepID=A0A8C1N792_CYPCA